MIYRTHVCRAEYFPEYLAQGIKSVLLESPQHRPQGWPLNKLPVKIMSVANVKLWMPSDEVWQGRGRSLHTHRLTSTAGFIGPPLAFGTDLWLVPLCAVTLGAHPGHSGNRARKKVRIFDVKCQTRQVETPWVVNHTMVQLPFSKMFYSLALATVSSSIAT